MKGTFTITISPTGDKIGVDIGDVTGAECVDLSAVFASLGNVEHIERKAEFYVETPENILVNG